MALAKGIDWGKAKARYAKTKLTHEQIAKELGCNVQKVHEHARLDHWTAARKKYQQKTVNLSINRAAEAAAKKDTRIYDICNSLIDKIAEAAVDIDPLNVQAFRALTIALKDIKDLRGDKDERDIAEQEARIAKLRADAKKAEEDRAGAAAVEIIGLPEDYKG